MRQDLLEICNELNHYDVQEYGLYNLFENAYELLAGGYKNSLPNVFRKIYEFILYKCHSINPEIYPLIYQQDNKRINMYSTTKVYFRNNSPELNNSIMHQFLQFVNSGSHCADNQYAEVRENEIKENLTTLLKITNWYIAKPKNIKKHQLETKFKLPKVETINNLKATIENLKNENANLRQELKDLKRDSKVTFEVAVEKDTKNTDAFDNTEKEGSVNLDILEKDVFATIDIFNKEKVYCTHRTVAMFLFGLKIYQTEFKNLADFENFGKYQDNKFSEYEYDTVINSLLSKEKIFLNGYFYNTIDYGKISNEELSKDYENQKIINYEPESAELDENMLQTLRKAIVENKEIEFTYLKSIPNLNRAIVSERHYLPLALLPREKYKEINNIDKNQFLNSPDVYYLKIKDKDTDGIEKNKAFKLSLIKDLKIVE